MQRFGRNQKRKMRQEIADLKAQLCLADVKRRNAEYRYSNAKREALNEFTRNENFLKMAFTKMAEGLGKALAPELLKYKDDLLKILSKDHLEFNELIVLPRQDPARYFEITIPLKPLHFANLIYMPN